MSIAKTYPKRLIEVDLPIKRISDHARREKRRGHISSMHIWWARRPLAACRAVTCAALWLDPVDPLCPDDFRVTARAEMLKWTSHRRQSLLSADSRSRFEKARQNPSLLDDDLELRMTLLDFLADFANWDNSVLEDYLETSRELTHSAHMAVGGTLDTKPLVADPFAGGGSIPLEALRVGAAAFASDINPVAVLLNKILLEYIPKYGEHLADECQKWGRWLRDAAHTELKQFYPADPDGAEPVAYLWARTIKCEGPACGIETPVTRSLWIDKSGTNSFALNLEVDRRRSQIRPTVIYAPKPSDVKGGTSKRSSVTCPACGYTTPRKRVESQAKAIGFGQMLMAVATQSARGRSYRSATPRDLAICQSAENELSDKRLRGMLPDEALPYLRSIFNVHVYGMQTWRSLFAPRQLLFLGTLVRLVREADFSQTSLSEEERTAVRSLLALVVSKSAMLSCNIARWRGDKGRLEGAFAMQALSMVWDWGEVNPFNNSFMVFGDLVDNVASVVRQNALARPDQGTAQMSSAVSIPLPDDSVAAIFTDPPYYDSIPYANLSDFFFVWLKRMLLPQHPALFADAETPKDNEIVQLAERNALYAHKTREFFEKQMELAMSDARRVTQPGGVACVVFAHKTTEGWEALLNAVLRAGWTITASWPIDTEMATRFKAIGTASLTSSVHLVCRPRESPDGSLLADNIGDWRDVLLELPSRIHQWMPRLADEGVVGADAIFACLGPALEIFSRYSRVEKASGDTVSLKEYLEHVWAAVSKEALEMIFTGVDSTGFEEDARLTAMWLWTISTEIPKGENAEELDDEVDEEAVSIPKGKGGLILEYDAARKIAQGLGAHLDEMTSLVEINGATARLLPVAERTPSLFRGGESSMQNSRTKLKKNPVQISLGFVAELEQAAERDGWGETGAPRTGETVLDRVHQSMILFGAGRGDALKRFLVDDGVGRDDRFWRLAQAFSSLYPSSTHEKRWVDGVLARKKGLGF